LTEVDGVQLPGVGEACTALGKVLGSVGALQEVVRVHEAALAAEGVDGAVQVWREKAYALLVADEEHASAARAAATRGAASESALAASMARVAELEAALGVAHKENALLAQTLELLLAVTAALSTASGVATAALLLLLYS
jgi:hypothetical protein